LKITKNTRFLLKNLFKAAIQPYFPIPTSKNINGFKKLFNFTLLLFRSFDIPDTSANISLGGSQYHIFSFASCATAGEIEDMSVISQSLVTAQNNGNALPEIFRSFI